VRSAASASSRTAWSCCQPWPSSRDRCTPGSRGRLADLVARLLAEFVEGGGRLIVSSYTDNDGVPRPLFDDLSDAGFPPDGRIRIDRPRRHPHLSAWIDA
jgi:hypothetical protein